MKLKAAGGIGILFIIVIAVTTVSCQSDEKIEFNRYYSAGSVIYQTKCQNCHGAHGEGLAALIPPLTDQAYLKTNRATLACFVKNGLKGKITIGYKTFEGEMPVTDLAPIEIAEVLTYITNSFGSKLGTINSGQVNNDLTNCK